MPSAFTRFREHFIEKNSIFHTVMPLKHAMRNHTRGTQYSNILTQFNNTFTYRI